MIQRCQAAATSSDSLPLIISGVAKPTGDLRFFVAVIQQRQLVEMCGLDFLSGSEGSMVAYGGYA